MVGMYFISRVYLPGSGTVALYFLSLLILYIILSYSVFFNSLSRHFLVRLYSLNSIIPFLFNFHQTYDSSILNKENYYYKLIENVYIHSILYTILTHTWLYYPILPEG